MSETVNRAAEAIMRVEAEEKISDYYKFARAAIASIREPTEALSEAMNAHASNGMVDWRDLHNAMIDEVLKD